MPHGEVPLADIYTHVDPSEAAGWLGCQPVGLSSLRRAGLVEHVVPPSGRPLVGVADLADGDSASFSLAYLPPSMDWVSAVMDHARPQELGTTTMTFTQGYGVPWGPPAMTIRRRPASGDSVGLVCQGTRVGVQHLMAGWTRLAWVLDRDEAVANVVVHTAQEPIAAVEMLVVSGSFA